ncbi:MAG: efflux RND transporter periplasmic adaptor subunit [Hyphomicrobium sp.]|jgi:cobalt-zinc-cadmium efflux system membrane fusion protein
MRKDLVRVTALLSLTSLSFGSAGARDVTVTPEQIAEMSIKVEAVQPAMTEAVALLPAVVKPALNARLSVSAPFGGTVTQVHVLPGQVVRHGDPLATISSRDLLEVQGQIAQSEAELKAAEVVARRKRDLVNKNIANTTVADEADAQVERIRAAIGQHRRMASLGGIRLGQAGQYVITAPVEGKVVEAHVLPGQKLDAMDAAVALDGSADLTVEAQVPASIINEIRIGDEIQVVGGPLGRIIAVGGSLDSKTRSATLIASIPHSLSILAGQMVTVTLLRPAASGSLSVPPTAVAWIRESNAVFVRDEQGFQLRPVKVRGKSPASATILGDVVLGAQVAVSGLPQLEMMLGE